MRVSIVVNNYNYADFVGRAVDSALEQTHPDVEVIVVDDGSADASPEVLRRYADRVTLIQKPNAGQGSAYNLGFSRTRGDLVVFLDADDWLYPQAAAEIVKAWRPGVSKVQYRLDMVDRDGAALGRRLPRELDDREAGEKVRTFGTYASPPGSGNAYHADFLRRVLPMEEPRWRTCADSVPILLAPLHGEVVSVPEALGAYRLHRWSDDSTLFFGNCSNGLADEYGRIESCWRLVEGELTRLGTPPAKPLALSPWDARALALCLRFGGPEMTRRLAGRSPASMYRHALASLWRWPFRNPLRRLLMMAWVVAVHTLPLPLARQLARLNRRSVGLPVGSPAPRG